MYFAQSQPEPVKGILRIHFRDGSYKSVMASPNSTCKEICDMLAQKIDLSNYADHFVLTEVNANGEGKYIEIKIIEV